MNYNIESVDDDTIINLTIDNQKCGYIRFNYDKKEIGIVHVKCDCGKDLKGQCLPLLLYLFLDYIKKVTSKTDITMFIEPDGHEYGTESYTTASKKLLRYYKSLGFKTEDDLLMYTTVKDLELVLNAETKGGKKNKTRRRSKKNTSRGAKRL
jgi:hypothetical protein